MRAAVCLQAAATAVFDGHACVCVQDLSRVAEWQGICSVDSSWRGLVHCRGSWWHVGRRQGYTNGCNCSSSRCSACQVTSRRKAVLFREHLERWLKLGERVGLLLQPESCACAATLLPESLWACKSTAAQHTHAKQAAGCWREEQVLAACGRTEQGGLGNNTRAQGAHPTCRPQGACCTTLPGPQLPAGTGGTHDAAASACCARGDSEVSPSRGVVLGNHFCRAVLRCAARGFRVVVHVDRKFAHQILGKSFEARLHGLQWLLSPASRPQFRTICDSCCANGNGKVIQASCTGQKLYW